MRNSINRPQAKQASRANAGWDEISAYNLSQKRGQSSRDLIPSPACRGGLGWGVSAASGGMHASACIPIVAKCNCALKPKQPHPNPPLLSQGREPFTANVKLCRRKTSRAPLIEVPV